MVYFGFKVCSSFCSEIVNHMIIKTLVANRGPERLNNMPKVAQLQIGRAEAALELPGLKTVLLTAVLPPGTTRTALGS